MNIDCQEKSITCDCGHTAQIQKATLHYCQDCQHFHFECNQCNANFTIPLELNDLIDEEIMKRDPEPESTTQSDAFGDVFLGENQIPLTDELIEQLVKEGMDREELIYMQKEGVRYSTTRKSFLFPPEGDFDEFLDQQNLFMNDLGSMDTASMCARGCCPGTLKRGPWKQI